MKLQARNFVVRKPETIDITMFFKKFCIATRTRKKKRHALACRFFFLAAVLLQSLYAPLTSFALDAIPRYDFRFARKALRANVRAYLLAYMAAHPGCTERDCKAACRRVFGWVPDLVQELVR